MSLFKIQEQLDAVLEKLNKSTEDLVITTNKCDETIHFQNPFNVKGGQIAFKLLTTYYSFPNISPGKNKFKCRTHPSHPYEEIEFETGAWELSAIADFLKGTFDFANSRHEYVSTNSIESQKHSSGPKTDIIEKKKQHAKSFTKLPSIKLSAQVSTMKSILEIPENYSVDFTGEDTIGKLLGFEKKVYEEGRHISENIVDINPINSIQVHCDIVNGSKINGQPSNCIYLFEPKAAPGHKMQVEPKNLVYYPVNGVEYISKLRVWLTDDNGNVVDNRGEKLSVVLSLKV